MSRLQLATRVASQVCSTRGKSQWQLPRKELISIRPERQPVWTTAEKAFQDLDSNQVVAVQMGAGSPSYLLRAMSKVIKQRHLTGIRIHHQLTLGETDLPSLEEQGLIRGNSFFTSVTNRPQIHKGLHDYTPLSLSDCSRVFLNGQLRPDYTLLQLSPPDRHGYLSFGLSVVVAKEAMQASRRLIGQVNRHCPRTFGDGCVHISQLDYLVEQDEPLAQLTPKRLTDEEQRIGKLIAEHLVDDGSTLQMGIGAIPDAVLHFCTSHRNLGIHSEMISDGLVPLIEKGIVNNSEKKTDQGKTVTSFALGTKSVLYDFLDENPSVLFRSVAYTNDESVIRQNPKITAINSCIELDLSGQAAADMIGPRIYSGFGGQLDFMRGAAMSDDGQGRPILAINSLTSEGQSKIVIELKPGAGVVSTRSHVHYVVTEHGIAYLFGKSLRQRAYQLIQIAHPKHREWLEREAFVKLGCMPSND